MTDVWMEIEDRRRESDVLRHPFYLRWTAGELKRSDLAYYAGQYRHLVHAIAELSERAAAAFPAREDLALHAREERAHVAIWAAFTTAAGGEVDASPNPDSAASAKALTSPATPVEILGRLYALELAQPEISKVKRDGLIELYGFSADRGTEYFRIHATLDRHHAAEVRGLLADEMRPEDEPRVIDAAWRSYDANWRLLDGVERVRLATRAGG